MRPRPGERIVEFVDIAAFLRQQRAEHGLTQREFARRGGVAGSSVRAYESGRRVPTIAAIEALLAGVGRQVCYVAEPLWADIDREISALQTMTMDERVEQVPVLLDWWHDRLAARPFALDGPFAALVQGAAVPARWLGLAVPRSAIGELAETFAGIVNLQRWSEQWHDWGYCSADPREPGPLRWRSPYGEVRVRLFEQPVGTIEVVVQGKSWRVRPLSDVESDDPWVTRVLSRMRGGLRSGP